MALSNHAIVALGILIRRAKKNFGAFKVSDILNSHQQAYELLTKAILSGDDELISLSIELNKSLKIEQNLTNALNSYVNYIKNDDSKNKSQAYLNIFVKYLYQIELDSTSYRQASNAFLLEMKKEDHIFCVNLIRHFYPYLAHKNSALSEINSKKTADINPQPDSLIRLWGGLDHTFITTLEESQLSVYTKAIKKINVKDKEIKLRSKIAKLIIIKQRSYSKTSDGYRKNIDKLQDYFSNSNLLDYFLSVSREFYSIWLDSQLSKGSKTSQ